MNELVLISLIIPFVFTFFSLPRWIKKCRHIGLVWEDMNKLTQPKNVAASGGVVIVLAFILGVLSFVAIRTFILSVSEDNVYIFALLNVILLLSIVGLVDDLLGWKQGGLSISVRLFFAFIASIPLVVINAGTPEVALPFFGVVRLGIFYPLFFIPIGIIGATTTYNFLAGFNGLEAGQGIIVLSFLSFVAYRTGTDWLAVIGLCMVSSLLVFYWYNKVPAKVFPGDILTYSIGALIAGMAILGNFEKIAVFIFIPYIIETLLKLRGGLKKYSFGIPAEDGSLELPYEKVYGLTHVSIFLLKKFKKKVYEKDVVYCIFVFQIIFCIVALFIFREGLFV